jgi:hypothetical protein
MDHDVTSRTENSSMNSFSRLSRANPSDKTIRIPRPCRLSTVKTAAQRLIMRKGSGAGSSPVQIGSLTSTP